MAVTPWLTPARREIIERDYPADVPWSDIRDRMRVADENAPLPHYGAVSNWANANGLYRSHSRGSRAWKTDELECLAELVVRGATADEFTTAIPAHTWRAIYNKILALGAKSPAPRDQRGNHRTERIPSPPRTIKLRCLGCQKWFMSRDRCCNRRCEACHKFGVQIVEHHVYLGGI